MRRSLHPVLITWAWTCSAQEAKISILRAVKAPNPSGIPSKAGWTHQPLVLVELGNAISRRGNWGPHMHPTTMWLSKQAGPAGPEGTQAEAGCQGCQASWAGSAGSGMDPASVDDLGSSIRRVPVWRDGMKIRTRGRIRSPCRNEPGGNWGSIGACQDLSGLVSGL